MATSKTVTLSKESQEGLHAAILAYLVEKGFTRSVKAFSKEATASSGGHAQSLMKAWENVNNNDDSDAEDSSDEDSDADSESSDSSEEEEVVAKPGIGAKAVPVKPAASIKKLDEESESSDSGSDSGSESDAFSSSSSSSSSASGSSKSSKSSSSSGSSAGSSSSESTKVAPVAKKASTLKVNTKKVATKGDTPPSASTTLDDEESEEGDVEPVGGFLDVEAEVSDDEEVSSDEEEEDDSEEEDSESDSDSEEDDSEDSESSEDEEPVVKKAVKTAKASAPVIGTKRKAASPSPSDSSASSDSAASSTSSSSSSGSSSSSSGSSSTASSTPGPSTNKKRKVNVNGDSIVTETSTVPGTATTAIGEMTPVAVTTTTTTTSHPTPNGSVEVSKTVDVIVKDNKGKRVPNQRFERIKAQNVTYHHDGLKDNSFDARIAAGAPVNDYGAKASRDLIVTRGAGFRKEKNKKKRGSYAGGEITMQSHSIKFDD